MKPGLPPLRRYRAIVNSPGSGFSWVTAVFSDQWYLCASTMAAAVTPVLMSQVLEEMMHKLSSLHAESSVHMGDPYSVFKVASAPSVLSLFVRSSF